MRNHLYLLISSLFFFHCTAAKHTSQAPNLMIELEKTGCRGFCPVYTLSIFSDRTVRFSGQAHTAVSEADATLTEEDYQKLLDAFNGLPFGDLDSSYTRPVADIPYTYLSFRTDQGWKKVTTMGWAPEGLTELVALTEEIAQSRDWIRERAGSAEKEVIVELTDGTDPQALILQFVDVELTLIKKITPNQEYFLFSVVTDDPEGFLDQLRKTATVRKAQWNHKLKKRN